MKGKDRRVMNREGTDLKIGRGQISNLSPAAGKVVFFWFIFALLSTFNVQLPILDSQAWATCPGGSECPPLPPGTVAVEEDIRLSRHNLSSSGFGTTHSASQSEVCVFCHTPHGASSVGASSTLPAIKAPIWNRNLSYRDTTAYVLYDQAWSFSFEGALNDPSKPTGYSRLCLSCHDGVIAIGSVINKPGSGGYGTETPTTDFLGVGAMSTQAGAVGAGLLTGDTRVLGTNLQNDHPISFSFDSNLAVNVDAELVDPGPPAALSSITPLAPAGGYQTGVKRYPGNNPADPLDFNKVQCTSCHNPHAVTYPKFLRAPRFQDATETGYLVGEPARVAPAGQIICLYCHSKPGWDNSTHDISQAVHAAYPGASSPYDFDGGHTVAAYACRNCHDPHTAQGAKRLHREGVTAFGAGDAVENTCFLCHSPNNQTVSNVFLPAGDPTVQNVNHRFCDGTNTSGACGSSGSARVAPDIYSEFAKDSAICLGGSGGGSAMCLQLAGGHEPVIISRSQEGVQLRSEGAALVPVNNETTPGITTLDTTHVECVDCHNPHQVNSPNLAALSYNGAPNPPGGIGSPGANGQGARLKGAKGVGIDITGTRPVVVSRCLPGYVICGRDTTVDGTSANRDPYVYEVCFRCHGNSYEKVFGPDTGTPNLRYPNDVTSLAVPDGFASYKTTLFSPRTDPTNGATGTAFSFRGFSNKWRELNPQTADVETPAMLSIDLTRYGQVVFSHTQQIKNPAYHPVVKPGRNGAFQLCNQLAVAFSLNCGNGPGNVVPAPGNPAAASAALSNLTIQCTDCHNNNAYDVYSNIYQANLDAATAAQDNSGIRGPLTESNLRPTDVWPDLNAVIGFNYVTDRPGKPIGPHGSINRRILRANYDTDILSPIRCFEQNNPQISCAGKEGDGYSAPGGTPSHAIAGGGGGINPTHFRKFLLCFQCHDRRGFDPSAGNPIDSQSGTPSLDKDRSWTHFFGLNTAASSGGVDSWWNGNLHMYHLRWTGAMCHECHYNVHSNVEALNTIFGDGRGGMLPPDSVDGMTDGVVGTHLINFGPQAEGTTAQKPMWFYDGTSFRCYLRCHNEVMDSCAYQSSNTGTPNARWCAGGRNPGTSG
ncbi:MAG: hypothetical protein HY204_01520 [Nitrospirae bacterium]|nr:hypothetical protein [Nitrospirota bacterium]